jgi:hypothetical protein
MPRDRVTAALTALAFAALMLSGCSSDKKVDITCPKIMPAPNADKIALFAPGGHAAKDVVVGGRITDLEGKCVREKLGVTLNAQIEFYAQRATMDIKAATFPYFVALVDPDGRLLTEEAFTLPVPFLPAESYRIMPAEKITVHLPVKNQEAGSAYTVLVGFQLTPDQIAFNRGARAQAQ